MFSTYTFLCSRFWCNLRRRIKCSDQLTLSDNREYFINNKNFILPVWWWEDRYSFWVSGLVKNWYMSSATTFFSTGGFSTTVIIFCQHTIQVFLSIQTWRTSESFLVWSYASLYSEDFISPYCTSSCSPIVFHIYLIGWSNVIRWCFFGSLPNEEKHFSIILHNVKVQCLITTFILHLNYSHNKLFGMFCLHEDFVL